MSALPTVRLNPRVRRITRTLVGIGLCAGSALLIASLFPDHPLRVFVPLGFVVIVVALAWRFGLAVSLYGSLCAALIFAYFMYAPVGSIAVSNAEARLNLAWMLLAATALSYFLLGPSEPTPPKH
jgi:K+-sensing histidine kinase KdpD